jgi:short chain dehydrogenase
MTGIEIPALSIPKVALVTGGNSGIGKATAARLAALGSAVVVGYNSRRAQAEEVVGGLQGSVHLAMRIAIDDPASISEAAVAVDKQYGRLDVLVNCGGATTPVPANDLEGLTDDIFDRTVSLNLRGAVRHGSCLSSAAGTRQWRCHRKHFIDCCAHGFGQQPGLSGGKGGRRRAHDRARKSACAENPRVLGFAGRCGYGFCRRPDAGTVAEDRGKIAARPRHHARRCRKGGRGLHRQPDQFDGNRSAGR